MNLQKQEACLRLTNRIRKVETVLFNGRITEYYRQDLLKTVVNAYIQETTAQGNIISTSPWLDRLIEDLSVDTGIKGLAEVGEDIDLNLVIERVKEELEGRKTSPRFDPSTQTVPDY